MQAPAAEAAAAAAQQHAPASSRALWPMPRALALPAAPPRPSGMSVNIIDLQGLKMSDAAGPAFRFIRCVPTPAPACCPAAHACAELELLGARRHFASNDWAELLGCGCSVIRPLNAAVEAAHGAACNPGWPPARTPAAARRARCSTCITRAACTRPS